MALPAHATKHLPLLAYPFAHSTFYLTQTADGAHNGTALWLAGQCLAFYLAHLRPNPSTAIELGSGVGLTALALASLGWDVLATDIHQVVSAVLSKNISHNLHAASGRLQIRELDWSVEPEKWNWNNPVSVTAASSTRPLAEPGLQPPFDLIFSADTVYSPDLVTPLLRTFSALSSASHALSGRHPLILLCVERRDPALLDRLLAEARQLWNFTVHRVPRTKLAKCIEKSGVQWDKEDWEGVEIWKLRLS
ncbi:hypothetical protein FA15DRAFT_581313 [Coprinopsis marcescibilis]|uniref:Uncharacterized protein n=1 Tax=Coprinopsis marcescibilis TaxID=230819 RepID=A0A5C3LAH3_COPMA|nr:hypothetical protein FA15DRAFT_581313 [Coprinopsis marcescibilis]